MHLMKTSILFPGLPLKPLNMLPRLRDRRPRLRHRPPRRVLRFLCAGERLTGRGDARVLAVASVEEARAAETLGRVASSGVFLIGGRRG